MENILQKYLRTCKEKYVPMGFVRNRQSFIRLSKDIIQEFFFERISFGHECRVTFSVTPLCAGWSYYPTGDLYLAPRGQYDPTKEWDYDPWHYDPHDEASIDACLRIVFSEIDREVIPFFEKTTDADSARIALEELGWRRSMNSYHRIVAETNGNPWRSFESLYQEFLALQPMHSILAMKAHCYDLAIADYEWIIRCWKQDIKDYEKSMRERAEPHWEEAVRRNERVRTADIERNKEWIRHLKDKDVSWVEENLLKNEADTLAKLKAEIPRLAKTLK